MTTVLSDLKIEMDRVARTQPASLTLTERASILAGANQVLRFLEDRAKKILNPPAADKDFYDIPLMRLNQGVTSNQIKGVKRFIASMGSLMESLPLPLSKDLD